MKKLILVISDSNSENKVRDIITKAHDEGKLIFIDTENQDGQMELPGNTLRTNCLNRPHRETLSNFPGPYNQVYLLLTGHENIPPGQKTLPGKEGMFKEKTFAAKYSLTHQEMTVLTYIIQGVSYADVADKLCISYHTVKNHMSKIFMKLKVNKRSAAIYKYIGYKYEMN